MIIEDVRYKNYPLALEGLKSAKTTPLTINYSKLLEVFTHMPEPEGELNIEHYNKLLDHILSNMNKEDLASNMNYYEHISPISLGAIKAKLGDTQFSEEVEKRINQLNEHFRIAPQYKEDQAGDTRKADDDGLYLSHIDAENLNVEPMGTDANANSE